MGQFYTFLANDRIMIPGSSIMNEVEIMAGITNP